MSAAAVAGGLAAGLAFSSDRASAIDYVGVVGGVLSVGGFLTVAVTTVLVWRPTEGQFAQDSGVLVGSYVEGDPPAELSELHRELALWLGKHAESNRMILEVQLRRFTVGLVGLLIEISGAILALGDVAGG